jgi:CheY-like chemotaxis protein
MVLPVVSDACRGTASEPRLFGFVRSDFSLLVVDDDDDVRVTTVEQLAQVGWTAESVDSGEKALVTLASVEVSGMIVILDMMMPGLGGEETLEGIRRDFPTLPVLLISGNVSGEVTERLTREPYTEFLPKPYDIEALETALWELIAVSQRES